MLPPGRNYAAKIMHGHSALKPFMKNELDILNLLNDRHLVRLHDAYEHEHTLALVLELAGGGELVRDRLLRGQYYTERDIAGYIRQVLRGLKYMHDNSVAHLGLTVCWDPVLFSIHCIVLCQKIVQSSTYSTR